MILKKWISCVEKTWRWFSNSLMWQKDLYENENDVEDTRKDIYRKNSSDFIIFLFRRTMVLTSYVRDILHSTILNVAKRTPG